MHHTPRPTQRPRPERRPAEAGSAARISPDTDAPNVARSKKPPPVFVPFVSRGQLPTIDPYRPDEKPTALTARPRSGCFDRCAERAGPTAATPPAVLRPVYASRFDSASFRAAGLPSRSGKLLSTVAAYLGCCVRARLTLHLPSQRQLARPAVAGMVALASYLGYGGTTFWKVTGKKKSDSAINGPILGPPMTK